MSWVKACTSGCSSAQHRGGPRGQPHSRNAVMQMNPPTLKQLLEFLCLLFGLLSLSLNFSRFLPTFPSLYLCLFSFPKRSLSLSLPCYSQSHLTRHSKLFKLTSVIVPAVKWEGGEGDGDGGKSVKKSGLKYTPLRK